MLSRNSKALTYILILIASLATRLYQLGSIGFVWDEVLYATYSRNIFDTLFKGVNIEHPPLLKILLSLFATSNFSEEFIRIPVALINSFIPFLVYLIAKMLYGNLIAIFSSILIILDINLIGYSRLATMDALLTTLALFSTYLALRRKRFLASIVLSLAILTRLDGILLIPILALTGSLKCKSFKIIFKDLLFYIIIAGITLLGWMAWLFSINKLDNLFAHYSTISILNTYPAILAEILYKFPLTLIILIPFAIIAPILGETPILILGALIWSIPRGILPYVGIRYHLYSISLIYPIGLDSLRRIQKIIIKNQKVFIILVIPLIIINILTLVSSFPYLISYLNPWSPQPVPYLSDSDLGWGSALREAFKKLEDAKIVTVNYAPHLARIYLKSAKIYSIPPLMNYSKPELSNLKMQNGSYIVRYIIGGKDWFYDPIIEEFAKDSIIIETITRENQKIVVYDISKGFKEKEINFWLNIAKTAWNYFKPGVGISINAGLNYANQWWHRATDWDLAAYISAIISARKLNLIDENEFKMRIEKILQFLETRKLSPKGIPYLYYDSDIGEPAIDIESNPSDAGKLLLALDSLRKFEPIYEERVIKIIQRNGIEKIASDQKAWKTTSGAYAHYIAIGFQKFKLANYSHIIEKIKFYEMIERMEEIKSYGISLPKSWITYEPILLEVYELNNTRAKEFLEKLIQVSKLRFKETSRLSAFSEGAIDNQPYYIYEWIVANGHGTWIITDHEGKIINIPEVAFTKVALGIYAYEESDYSKLLIEKVLILTITDNGFYEGIFEDGTPIKILTDKTNSLILSIALQKLIELKVVKP
jgi:hypothetical protein